ncbi:MAG: hypothetical protein ABI221_01525 [Candidatus Saccharimonadales bacterium]
MLTTPKHRKAVLLPGLALLLSQPVFTFFNYSINLNKGIYSPNSDSIGIPIFSEFVIWFFLIPFAIYGLVWATRRYPGKVPLISAKSKNPSLKWDIAFAFLIFGVIIARLDSIYYLNMVSIIDVVLLILLLIELRVIILARSRRQA